MADESKRVAALSADKLRRLMSRLTERQGTAAGIQRISRTLRAGALPLSFAQERLWFLDRLGAGGAAYHIPAAVRLRGPLDANTLERTLGVLVDRHEALRTTFGEQDGLPSQTVHAEARLALPRVDLASLPEALRAGELARISREEAVRPFDLARGPLLRTVLVRLGAGDHVLVLAFHHIITDGWSLGVLVREVAALYPDLAAGAPADLPELPIQPADHAVWERERLQGKELESELAFWRERLAGVPPLELPADRPRPASPSSRGGLATLDLSGETARAIEALAQREKATPFMALLALFQALLLRYTGQSDFGIGTPVAHRTRSEVEGLIGVFVNTLVLRVDLAGEPGFAELLRRAREVTLAAFAHEELPFEKLVEELRPEREPGRNPLFQVLFTLQNQPWPKLRVGELDLELSEIDTGTARADLTLIWRERDGGLAGTLEYSTDLFERASAERLLGHLAALLRGALADPESTVWDLPLLGEAERAQVLGDWRGSVAPYPREATVHELFAEQAAAAGDRIAVETGEARLTYAELESRANQLARHLRRLGVGPDCLVGLAVPRSPETVVGLLGILKAGGAYLPLDPAYPRERLDTLVDEARPRALVTLEPLLGRLPAGIAAVCLDRDRETLAAERRSAPAGRATADNLVYVLYTSGSTGQPKGVAVPHRGVARLVRGAGFARLDAGQVLLQLAPLSFDASTLEIWGALCNGGRLVLAPPEPPSLAELGRLLTRHGVTTLWLTAGLFHQMVDQVVDERIDTLRGLSQLLAGGDMLSPAHVRRAVAALPGCDLINGYGPTENTTFTCCHVLTKSSADTSVPIGRPIGNSTVVLLDRSGRPVPVGVPGELLAGGDGLARGYLGRPDLTAERFVPSPLSGKEDATGARLYRTGDLARWRPDGTLDFLGRIDQQVKLRGFRIEPGEIEAALGAHPGIAECAVVVQGAGEDRRLVAWFTPREDTEPEPAELRAWLATRLPAYMVPSIFALLEALPLNPNGKVDRRALARLQPPSAEARGTEPETPLERRIAEVWSDVLGQPRIGRDDDFFALGGHSLLATRVVSRLREELGIELPLVTVFENPTLAALAIAVEQAAGSGPDDGPIPATEGAFEAPLSFAQERLWFLEQLRPGSSAYNVPAAVRLVGALNPAVLAACFSEVARRHATLRASFAIACDEPCQKVAHAAGVPVPLVDLAALSRESGRQEALLRTAAEAGTPFDLATGPLLRATLLRLGTDEHLLLLTLHHIVADGWSVGILVRETAALYAAFTVGQPSPLPELPVQYTDFALWQRRRLSGALLDSELRFWSERLHGAPAELALPVDRPRPAVAGERGASCRLRLAPELAEGVRALALQAGVTPFMVLLAAFETLLSRLSAQADLTVGTPVAGRQRAEIEGLIGLFVNTLVLRADLAGAPSFSGLLARTRRHALEAYAHQELPFEKLVEQLQPGRNLGNTPLFQAFFALQNAPVEPLRLPGLGVELLPEETRTAKFDLTLVLSEEAEDRDGFAGELVGSADLFEGSTIQRWAGCFERLLATAIQAPRESVFELPLLAEAERRTILGEWSSAGWELPAPIPVHELFAEQAARTPDKAAVVCRGESLSYRELAERAGRLADRLASLGDGGLVGLMATPDLALPVGMLGILEAGRGFVPLDPGLPAERLERMAAECGLAVLAADRRSLGRAIEIAAGAHVVCLDDELGTLPPAVSGTVDGTAYVIFTSGSTGVPKGVPITHENLLPFLLWSREVFGFGEHTRVLQSLSYAFDFGVFEILSTVLFGGTLVLRGDAERSDIEDYLREVRRHAINTLHTTPSFFRAVAASAGAEGLPTVEVLHLGGEALTEALVEEAFRATGPECRLFNGYGPTEAAVNCALYEVGQAADWRPRGLPSLPIGRPSAANRLYVLDRRMQPVPVGVHGELLVGGVTLSRGYFGRPDLTAARFVPDPFGEPGGRLYRTGDLVRFHTDRAIEFLGRIDGQVKIRGYRIELEEIEAALAAHPEVGACAVVAVRQDGEARLVAYVATRQETDIAELRRFLGRTLPAYMVPASFVFLPELPLNASGKADRRALALLPAAEESRGSAEPATPLERRIATVWSDLLGQPRIGRDDDFFALGGHSLLATRVVSRLRQELGIELPVLALFEAPTLAGLARVVEEAGAAPLDQEPIASAEGLDEAPLSFSQERLWFLEQLRPGSATYNIPASVRISGALDPAVLAACLGEIVRRHATLRATFPEAGGKPRQQVAAPAGVDVPLVDLSTLPEEVRQRESLRLAAAEAAAPFGLAAGPLLRAALLWLGADEHLLLLTVHHIVADGWSIGLLIREMGLLFESFATGRPAPLPELPVQYADFALWQRRRLDGSALERELGFWSERLRGATAELALPTDRPRPAMLSGRGASRRSRLSAELTQGVRALALRSGATPFMVLLAAFEALLSRLSGQADLTIGTPVAGRQRAELESLIGLFVNTLVMRADLADAPSFAVFLARTRQHALEAYTHQEIPFEKLVEHLRPGRSLGQNPLFQVLFALQNQPWPELRLTGLSLSPVEVDSGTTKTDLNLVWHEAEGAYEAVLEYSTDLFEEATAERLLRWGARLLGAALENPATRVAELPLLDAAERAAVLDLFRGLRTPYPRAATIHGLVREQVRRTPEAIAVEMGGERLTYAELDARANRLAHRLLAFGVRPDSRVGLAVERSADLVVGMLGILAAGGAYVPLDLSYPQERLDWMVEDAGLAALVHGGAWQGSAAASAVDLTMDWGEAVLAAPAVDTTADHLAYVIYTSGSTGLPKGVAVPHRAVVRLLIDTDYVRLEPSDRVAQASNASFDAATFEIWGALFAGARLVGVPQDEVLSPEALAQRLANDGITALFLTTALFNQMARQVPGAFRGLRNLLFGGELVDPGAVREVLRHGPPERLLHVYGPTETTTFATWHRVAELPAQAAAVPIGRPLANSTAFVVDPAGAPAPPGSPGELLLGGDGLARGYQERPELTAERFVPHPWSDRPGDRLYRTGDLVRLGSLEEGGAIEFLGRIDQQVKIRGFRIEPGEIETALAAHPEVADCAVIVLGSSGEDRRLVAWLAPREGAAAEPAALRSWLAARLPAYMVPAVFAPLPALPLTPNGKVDRRALARLQPPSAEARGAAPETPVERRIAAVWSDLLRQPQIDRDDNFFDLGGHSLMATQVVSRLRDQLGVEIPVRTLFEERTLAGLALRIEAALRADPTSAVRSAAPVLRPVERKGRLPLSFAQERLWFLEQLEPGSAFYNIPLASRLTGPLQVGALRQGIAELVRRHESLRTTFGDEQGRPFQIIAATAYAEVPLVDLSGLPEPLLDSEMRRQVTEETRRPFDLARGPLFRIPLFRLGREEHALVPTMHHIISDGWSMTVLLREIVALYGALSAGRAPELPELPVQYADYAVWQRGYLQGEELQARLDWWRERLIGVPGLQLPTDRPRPPVETFRGRQRLVALSAGLTRCLHELASREGATLFMTLLAVFQTLLLRVTGQTDLPVGSPIANRNRSEIEGVIGFFANTIVLRTDLSGNPSFRELLRRVREVTLGAYAHEDLPFEKLVEEIQPERDMSRNPLFQVMCVLQNQPWPDAPMGEVVISSLPVDSGTAKFDLTLFWREDAGVLSGLLEHNTDLFDDATAWRLYRHHEALLRASLDDPEARLGALPLFDDAERHQILREWNGASGGRVWAGRCVHDWVEEQVARTPGALAVIDADRTLTYAELDARANRLARGLARRGVRPEALVGICVERSLEMVVAALAVLKAGGALVALDPAYPRERLAAIIDDARLAVLLTQASLLQHFPQHQGIAFLLERGDDPFPEESEVTPRVAVDPDHPIYAIYTSGSTGQPKGIVVTHRAFSNLLDWQLGDPGLRPGGRTVQFATFGFCVSFQEMLSAWCSGGTLVLADEMTRRDLPGLALFLEEHAIDRLHLPFAALKHLAEAAAGQRLPTRLRTVITAGEQLQVTPAVRSLFERLPGCTLSNQYGASETHVVTALTLSGDPAGWPAIPAVGRPVDNVGIHLLDAGLEPVPLGVPGELYTGGACTPRCYLNDPALTASKLVPDPFSGMPGARLYRTGDAARYLADGLIEYHGRIDTQVKIRGFRVELGEIETVLARHPGVRDAAVVARPGHDGQRLVAYVVPAGESDGLFDELRALIKQKLPEHMLPSAFVEMPVLPVNANGKLDQAALPEPEAAAPEQDYVAPRTPTEELIAGIWAEVLGLERVGVCSDFFELGGHSLLATQVVARMRQALGVDLGVRSLFEARTVEELNLAVAEALLALANAPDTPLESSMDRVRRDEPLPLSFAQQRLWFLDQLTPGNPVYNLPATIELTGRLDAAALAATFTEVVRRHEVLRTTYSAAAGEPVQVIAEPAAFALPLVDLQGLRPEETGAEILRLVVVEARRPFELVDSGGGPMLRATLLRMEPERHIVLLTMHHIASDGWSLGVLVREVGALYSAFAAGRPSPLPELPLQYADFAAWQRRHLSGGRLEAEIGWWSGRLAGLPPALDLPTDRPRQAALSGRGAAHIIRLGRELRAGLTALSRRQGTTPFMTLLAGFATLLGRHAGQDDLAVGTPIAGRTRVETEPLIGFFVNTLVLRTDLSGDPGFAELLGRVREATLSAYAHQEIPFERLVEELVPERDLSRPPLVQVLFGLQNTPQGRLELPGLELAFSSMDTGAARVELTCLLTETEQGLQGVLEYSRDLFEGATIERMAGHLARLLTGVVADPRRRLSELPLLSEAERAQLLVEWGGETTDYPRESTIHALFAEQAALRPDAIAVADPDESLTYGELRRRAGRLARRLLAVGVGLEVRVGICLDRSAARIVATLAVLEAGGAYVPLDPSHPRERLATLIDASAVSVLVTEERWVEALPPTDATVLCVSREEPREERAELPDVPASALAYVMYTSGSTGEPKGVAVPHRAVVRLVRETGYARFGPDEVFLHLAPYAFDASTLELWGALLNGGRVVVPPPGLLSPAELGELLRDHGVTTLWLTAGLFHQMVEDNLPGVAGVRQLLAGGDVLSPEHVRRVAAELPGTRLINGYGPTENTTFTCCHPIAGPDSVKSPVPLGRPIANTWVAVLDRHLEPVPVGVAGELCAGGDGLARGYLGRPDWTAERFVPAPFGGLRGEVGGRLYRTGDRVRYLPDGRIEFLGRFDAQVKIRGFRIEPGEIEAALVRCPGVREAAVVARPGHDGQRLVAYVVPASATAEGDGSLFDELRIHLRQRLPEPMIPSAFVEMPSLPLNANGKLDREALPEPEAALAREEYVAPRTPVEELIAGIWAEVLGLERVGVTSDFFVLGGHSLLATRMVTRLRQTLGVDLTVRAVFEARTVEELTLTVAEKLLELADAEAALEAFAAAEAEPVGAAAPGRMDHV